MTKSPTRSSPRSPRAPMTIALSTDMPGNPRAIVAEAEQRFPVRIVIKVPPGGNGTRYIQMTEWLDENCGRTSRRVVCRAAVIALHLVILELCSRPCRREPTFCSTAAQTPDFRLTTLLCGWYRPLCHCHQDRPTGSNRDQKIGLEQFHLPTTPFLLGLSYTVPDRS